MGALRHRNTLLISTINVAQTPQPAQDMIQDQRQSASRHRRATNSRHKTPKASHAVTMGISESIVWIGTRR